MDKTATALQAAVPSSGVVHALPAVQSLDTRKDDGGRRSSTHAAPPACESESLQMVPPSAVSSFTPQWSSLAHAHSRESSRYLGNSHDSVSVTGAAVAQSHAPRAAPGLMVPMQTPLGEYHVPKIFSRGSQLTGTPGSVDSGYPTAVVQSGVLPGTVSGSHTPKESLGDADREDEDLLGGNLIREGFSIDHNYMFSPAASIYSTVDGEDHHSGTGESGLAVGGGTLGITPLSIDHATTARAVSLSDAGGGGDFFPSLMEVISEPGDTDDQLSPTASVSRQSRRSAHANLEGGHKVEHRHTVLSPWQGLSRPSDAHGGAFRRTSHVAKRHTRQGKSAYYLNQYLVSEVIGTGACGKVWLAYDTDHDRRVAIKEVPRPRYPKDRFGRGRSANDKFDAFKKEISVMQKLRHKNIVSVYEAIDDPREEAIYLVMKYISKGPIARLCPRNNEGRLYDPVPPAKLANYARQMLAGLEYLHRHRVVHRDIKPDNILIDENEQVYLADFGVAESLDTGYRARVERQMQQSLAMSQAMSVCGDRHDGSMIVGLNGTLPYLAPELWKGNCKAEPVDMWAVGVTLYTLLIGKLPFQSSADSSYVVPPVPPHFNPLWKELIAGLLNTNPSARLTAHDARAVVKKIIESEKDYIPQDPHALLLRLQREAAAKGVSPTLLQQNSRTFGRAARHQRADSPVERTTAPPPPNSVATDGTAAPIVSLVRASPVLSPHRRGGSSATASASDSADSPGRLGLPTIIVASQALVVDGDERSPFMDSTGSPRRDGSVKAGHQLALWASIRAGDQSGSSRTEAYASTAAPSPTLPSAVVPRCQPSACLDRASPEKILPNPRPPTRGRRRSQRPQTSPSVRTSPRDPIASGTATTATPTLGGGVTVRHSALESYSGACPPKTGTASSSSCPEVLRQDARAASAVKVPTFPSPSSRWAKDIQEPLPQSLSHVAVGTAGVPGTNLGRAPSLTLSLDSSRTDSVTAGVSPPLLSPACAARAPSVDAAETAQSEKDLGEVSSREMSSVHMVHFASVSITERPVSFPLGRPEAHTPPPAVGQVSPDDSCAPPSSQTCRPHYTRSLVRVSGDAHARTASASNQSCDDSRLHGLLATAPPPKQEPSIGGEESNNTSGNQKNVSVGARDDAPYTHDISSP